MSSLFKEKPGGPDTFLGAISELLDSLGVSPNDAVLAVAEAAYQKMCVEGFPREALENFCRGKLGYFANYFSMQICVNRVKAELRDKECPKLLRQINDLR
jgi:hypothetical protein